METTVLERPPEAVTDTIGKVPPLTQDEILEALALAIEAHGSKKLRGIEAIENYTRHNVDRLPIDDSTIFTTIADELEDLSMGPEDRTVGGVVAKLGYKRGTNEAKQVAHDIGCDCKGTEVGARTVANRIRALKSGTA